jgi:hypothetical protein
MHQIEQRLRDQRAYARWSSRWLWVRGSVFSELRLQRPLRRGGSSGRPISRL